jgi:hypothetical protein
MFDEYISQQVSVTSFTEILNRLRVANPLPILIVSSVSTRVVPYCTFTLSVSARNINANIAGCSALLPLYIIDVALGLRNGNRRMIRDVS